MTNDRQFSVLAYPSHRDTLSNPYIRFLYDEAEGSPFHIESFSIRRALVSSADVVHVHWPEWAIVQRSPWKAYPRLFAFMAAIFLARVRGAAVVWTVHNLHPHRRVSRVREGLLYAFLRHAVDQQIHLTDATHSVMEDTRHPARNGRWTVIEHGSLNTDEARPDRGGFRRKHGLGADSRLVAFFGGSTGTRVFPTSSRRFVSSTIRAPPWRSAVGSLIATSRPRSSRLRRAMTGSSCNRDICPMLSSPNSWLTPISSCCRTRRG